MINDKYPTTKPSLNLDFANTKSLDPRITFRRGTPGTYYDGVTHVKAEENLVYPSIPDNNWSASGYTVTTNSTTAPDGTTTASKIVLNNTTTTASVRVDPSVSINNFYTFSIYAKAGELSVFNLDVTNSIFGDTGINVDLSIGSIISSGSDNISSSITDVGNGWYRIVMVGESIATGTTGYIIRNVEDTGDGSSGFYLWGAQLEKRDTVTSYTATNGTPITKYQPKLMTDAADTARFDHDPITSESKGLLIEESRTNLVVESEDISHMNEQNVLIEHNTMIAPDGTNTADKLIANASSATHNRVYSNPLFSSSTDGDDYTLSFYAKKGELHHVYATLWDSTGVTLPDSQVWFNLLTGEYNLIKGLSANMEELGNGWYRCSVSSTNNASTNAHGIRIQLGDDIGGNPQSNFQGDGYSGIYIWGLQLELGSFPTSYIKTTGASATRSADHASITGENFNSWYRQDEGTFQIDFNHQDDDGWDYILSINPSTEVGDYDQNNLSLRRNGSVSNDEYNIRAFSSGSSLTGSGENLELDGVFYKNNFKKLCFSYDRNNIYFSNKNQLISDSISDSLRHLKALYLFNIDGAPRDQIHSFRSTGYIKKLAYYPQRLTNEQLQNLTK